MGKNSSILADMRREEQYETLKENGQSGSV